MSSDSRDTPVRNVQVNLRDSSTPLGMTRMTRRQASRLISASAVGLSLGVRGSRAQAKGESSAMLTRTIPSSGEKLPVIGIGTWRAFDVDLSADVRKQLEDEIGRAHV